jgi:hypothetical protein
MMVRQGDLLIVKVDRIPQKAYRKDTRVLAEGEATGHLHELDTGELYEDNGILYFRIGQKDTATLKHPEHGPLKFGPGDYKVVVQREYVPGGWRDVTD